MPRRMTEEVLAQMAQRPVLTGGLTDERANVRPPMGGYHRGKPKPPSNAPARAHFPHDECPLSLSTAPAAQINAPLRWDKVARKWRLTVQGREVPTHYAFSIK